MKQVTSEEWAAHCARFRCYGSEPDSDTLIHKLILGYDDKQNIIPGGIIGKVDYSTDPSTYYVQEPCSNPT